MVSPQDRPKGSLAHEIEALRQRLAEAEETIDAIRNGAVDAFLIQDGGKDRVYTLQSADRPYRVLVETMQQGAVVCSADGTVLFANGRIAEMLQIPHAKVTGMSMAQFAAPEQRLAFDLLLKQCQDVDVRGELTFARADGSTFPAHLTITRLPDDGAACFSVIITDLTRDRAHEALEQSERSLRRSEEVLKTSDRRKDEFLATLAHELRTPLAPIRSALEVLRLKVTPTPDIEWAQNVIDRQVQRMARLVDDLLDLSRIAHDQLVLRRALVDLSDVIRSALEICRTTVETAGHEVSVTLPPAPVILNGDPTRLAQVFANLLDNAASFTDRFGRIELAAASDGDVVSVSVRDNGRGIPADVLPHVFEMFFKVDPDGGDEHTGLGLGLPLVQKLIALHGGTVKAESDGPGQGSVFTVRLPVREDAVVPEAEPERRPEAAAAQRRVMVVDDNVDGADALAVLLRLLGHEVRTVYSGEAAIAEGRAFEPQIILMDIGMPGTDGHATCRAIREQSWGEEAHIIAVTGWGQPDDRRRTAEAGFDHHLVKPVDPARLTQMLAALGPRRATPWPEIAPRQTTGRKRHH